MAGEFDTFQDLNDVKKQSLRGGLGSLPRGPQKRDRDKTKKPKRAGKKTTFAQERKYQMLKLIKSGRTLREAKALTKALAVGLTPEYLAKSDELDLSRIEYGLDRLTRTRGQQIDFLKFKFKPRTSFPIKQGRVSCSLVNASGKAEASELEARWKSCSERKAKPKQAGVFGR